MKYVRSVILKTQPVPCPWEAPANKIRNSRTTPSFLISITNEWSVQGIPFVEFDIGRLLVACGRSMSKV